jgi:hypothetical protein
MGLLYLGGMQNAGRRKPFQAFERIVQSLKDGHGSF